MAAEVETIYKITTTPNALLYWDDLSNMEIKYRKFLPLRQLYSKSNKMQVSNW
jgi:hypothetical protein